MSGPLRGALDFDVKVVRCSESRYGTEFLILIHICRQIAALFFNRRSSSRALRKTSSSPEFFSSAGAAPPRKQLLRRSFFQLMRQWQSSHTRISLDDSASPKRFVPLES